MIFNVPPYCPYEITKDEIEYMGWVDKESSSNKTIEILNKLANFYINKTFLCIKQNSDSQFAIKHRFNINGTIFRVFKNIKYFGDTESWKYQIIYHVKALGIRKTPLPAIIAPITILQPRNAKFSFTIQQNSLLSSKISDNFHISNISSKNQYVNYIRIGSHEKRLVEFSKLAITTVKKEEKQEMEVKIEPKMYRSIRTQTYKFPSVNESEIKTKNITTQKPKKKRNHLSFKRNR